MPSFGSLTKLFADFSKDEAEGVIRTETRDSLKNFFNNPMMRGPFLRQALHGMSRDTLGNVIGDMIKNGEKDTVKNLFKKIGEDGVKDIFTKDGKKMTEKEIRTLFKKGGAKLTDDEIREMLGPAARDIFKGDALDLGGGLFGDFGKDIGKDIGKFPLTKGAKYAALGYFGYETYMRLNTQSASECKSKCKAGTNTENPDSNCDTSKMNAAECEAYCDIKGTGKCTEEQRKEDANKRCGGFKMAKCAADTTLDGAEGILGFISKYGDYIFTGIWIVIFIVGLSLLYKFLKMFTSTKYNQVQDWMQRKVCPTGQTLGPSGKRCVPI